MICRFEDFANKDVVCIGDGTRLGCVDDMEINTRNACILAIIIYGRRRCFGLFGREPDIIIKWCDIKLIGEDTILVDYCCPAQPPRRNFWDNMFK